MSPHFSQNSYALVLNSSDLSSKHSYLSLQKLELLFETLM